MKDDQLFQTLQHAYHIMRRTLEYPVEGVMRRSEYRTLMKVAHEAGQALRDAGYAPGPGDHPHWTLQRDDGAE